MKFTFGMRRCLAAKARLETVDAIAFVVTGHIHLLVVLVRSIEGHSSR